MSNHYLRSLAAALGVAGLLWGAALPALAQEEGGPRRPVPQGKTPRTPEGKPDLSGIWGPERLFIYDISSALTKGEELPIQQWAKDLTAKHMSKDDPEALCLPTGVPRQAPYPYRIIQTKDLIVMLFEGNIHSYRQIFMDRTTHPKDLNPTWFGDSVGHWEGDTLVIDTIGFNDRFWFDFAGHPHTEKLHTIERYNRPDLGHLTYDVTIDDPGAYTKPFVMHGKSPLLPGEQLIEYICNENNKDVEHILGKDDRK